MGHYDFDLVPSYHPFFNSPYGYKIALFILTILVLRLLIILIAHYSERYLIKKFLHRLKQLLKNGDDTDASSLKEKIIPRKDNSNFIERDLSRYKYRFYAYLKEELFALIDKASKRSDKYSRAPDIKFFSEGIKRKLSARSNKIKFTVLFSLPAALIAFLDQLELFVDPNRSMKDTVYFFQLAFSTLGEVILIAGTFLLIIFFLSVIGHFSIKKKFNLIADETEEIINTVCKWKANEK
ncbi:MAG: hypothetical protein GY940_06305 [bacterium]|nr:hypothetical protein [bacterium]